MYIKAFWTGPFFESLKIVSIFEYLKLRYDSEAARLLGVTLYSINSFIRMGIFLGHKYIELLNLNEVHLKVH